MCFGACTQDPALATAEAPKCSARVAHYKRVALAGCPSKAKPQPGKWAVEEQVVARFTQAAWPGAHAGEVARPPRGVRRYVCNACHTYFQRD
eukprot:2836339-Alexandrium_andersonii.AAC.1